jgi:hypothetical protein
VAQYVEVMFEIEDMLTAAVAPFVAGNQATGEPVRRNFPRTSCIVAGMGST